jgi:pilus assembly protein CpaC
MCQLPRLSAQATNPTLPPVNHNDLFTKPATITKPAATDRAPMVSSMGDFVSAPPVEQQLHLVVGRSVFVNTRHRMTRVYVTSPSILDSYTASPNQLVITAKKAGSSSLIVWDESGESQAFMVNSDVNVTELRDALGKAMPNGNVQVSGQEGKIVLTGTAGTEKEAEAAGKMAGLYSKEVTNAVVVNPSAVKQVTLKVRIVEVDRSKLNTFAFNFINASSKLPAYAGATSATGSTSISAGNLTNSTGIGTTVSISNPLNFLLYSSRLNIGATLQDLQTMNILQILAEPSISAMSGEKGSFLAGGEFPFPIVQGGAGGQTSISVQFKPYGVKLEFTPIVNVDGTIDLKVAPEVSSLDYSNAVTISGYTIPALSTRKAETRVVLRSGQTFAISGLLDKTATDQFGSTPGIASIPIIGQLFKNKNINHTSQELVVIVTPTVIDPVTDTAFPEEPKLPVPMLDYSKFDKSIPETKKKQ